MWTALHNGMSAAGRDPLEQNIGQEARLVSDLALGELAAGTSFPPEES